MTATLLAANAAWTGLVIALWTKRLSETHYARLLIVQRSGISLSRFPRYRKAFTPHIQVVSAGVQRAGKE
jgi:hypothetical protein